MLSIFHSFKGTGKHIDVRKQQSNVRPSVVRVRCCLYAVGKHTYVQAVFLRTFQINESAIHNFSGQVEELPFTYTHIAV